MGRSLARGIPILALMILWPGFLVAQEGGDPLLTRQRELQSLKGRMEENRAEIDRLLSKERKLGDLDARLRRDREMTTRYISELEHQERAIIRDLTDRQVQLDDRTVEHEKIAGSLRQRLRAYQRARRPHTAELLLSSRNFGELFARGALLARAIQRDRTDLIWLHDLRQELALATSMLESRRRGLDTLQEEKLSEKEHLDTRSQEARREIADVRKAREVFEQRQDELAEAEKRIQSIITRLEEAERARASGDAGPGLNGRRGSLPWPTKGEVIGQFGFHVHPRFGTRVPNKGIDIASTSGTPVSAVASGIAEFVDWLSGYGRCVILNHGEGYYTLYAHCSRVLVAQGARVGEGQKIAEVGDTDSVKGSCLHFEIRHHEAAVNPRDWLE